MGIGSSGEVRGEAAGPEVPPIRPDGLQMDEDRRFQERWWTGERVAQSLFWLVIAAALAGLTGRGGPFATATVATAAGELDAPRVARWQGSATLVARFHADRDRHRLELGGAFASFAVESVTPQPLLAFADGRRLTFEFDGSGEGAVATLRLRPEAPGIVRWSAALDGAPSAPLVTVVLP
jgi:hypothetical protein